MMSDDPHIADHVRLDALAERISAELKRLLYLSLDLQDAMSRCTSLRNHDLKALGALQGIDRISQDLCDLARLTEEIGLRTPNSILLERQPLDARLRLRDLSLRLQLHYTPSPDCTPGNPPDLEREPGDALFF
jgi:hypothetical protein